MENIVTISHGRPIASSIDIAEKFGKRPSEVNRAIKNAGCSKEFALRNFAQCYKINRLANGKREPYYEVTRDGFMFIAMGFTGKEAAQWKEKYIGAFNLMESELLRLAQLHADPDWQQARLEGKSSRREATDAVQQFVAHAKGQGSGNAQRYYQILTEDIYRALFVLDGKVKVSRDQLTAQQLTAVSIAERVLGKSLLESITSDEQYKAVRLFAIEKVRQFAELIGRSVPGVNQTLIAQK